MFESTLYSTGLVTDTQDLVNKLCAQVKQIERIRKRESTFIRQYVKETAHHIHMLDQHLTLAKNLPNEKWIQIIYPNLTSKFDEYNNKILEEKL